MVTHLGTRLTAALGAALCIGLVTVDTADAQRRGGGFGSRGARTYSAPPPTRTAPQQAAPIQRSMTQPAPGQQAGARPAQPGAAAAAAQPQRRGGFLGGMGGGLLGGLLAGGLIGALLGNGFGAGMAGFGAMLLQIAIIGAIVFLALRLFRRRQPQSAFASPAAGAAPGGWPNSNVTSLRDAQPQQGGFGEQGGFAGFGSAVPVTPAADTGVDFQVNNQDRQAFERLLVEIQDGLNREDYAALRERTTPEVMGFIAENLAQNATNGHRHDVSGTQLLEADVAEAWREGDRDYATAAMRFEGLDVLRDRASGAPVDGDPDRKVQTTELWTFVRPAGGSWKLSAIQEA